MATSAISLPVTSHQRLAKRILILLIVLLLGILYYEWRSTTRIVGQPANQDTMCMAARIGLPCRG